MINELAAKVERGSENKFRVIFPDGRKPYTGQLDEKPRKEDQKVQVAHIPATLAGWPRRQPTARTFSGTADQSNVSQQSDILC